METEKRILRRMSFLYSAEGKAVNLLTIVEQIEPDMPDYDFSPKELVACHEETFRIDVEDSLFIEGWQDDVKSVCGQMKDDSFEAYHREPKERHLVLSREFDKTQLTEMLPFRKGPYYVICYRNSSGHAKEILENEELRQQVSAISEHKLGFDICKYEQWIGGVYMVWHHPVIRDIHFTGTDNPAGMLCTIDTRKPVSLPLTFKVTDRDKEGTQIGEPVEVKVDIATRRFLLRTPQPVTRPDVDVFDEHGELVYSIKGIIFIKKIVLNMGVVDGVTGKKEALMERDVISADAERDKDGTVQKREELTRRILGQLKTLPQEESEIIIEEVRNRLGGKR